MRRHSELKQKERIKRQKNKDEDERTLKDHKGYE